MSVQTWLTRATESQKFETFHHSLLKAFRLITYAAPSDKSEDLVVGIERHQFDVVQRCASGVVSSRKIRGKKAVLRPICTAGGLSLKKYSTVRVELIESDHIGGQGQTSEGEDKEDEVAHRGIRMSKR